MLLSDFVLKQHIDVPIHVHVHSLDLIIAKEHSQLVKGVSVTEGISDHSGILFELSIAKQRPKAVKKIFHQFKRIDVAEFQSDIELFTL